MLSPRYKNGVFVVLLALALAAVMSLVMTLRVHRLDGAFADHWARTMLIGLAAVVPAALLVMGPLRKAAEWMCR